MEANICIKVRHHQFRPFRRYEVELLTNIICQASVEAMRLSFVYQASHIALMSRINESSSEMRVMKFSPVVNMRQHVHELAEKLRPGLIALIGMTALPSLV